jgi:hypothetical protein
MTKKLSRREKAARKKDRKDIVKMRSWGIELMGKLDISDIKINQEVQEVQWLPGYRLEHVTTGRVTVVIEARVRRRGKKK